MRRMAISSTGMALDAGAFYLLKVDLHPRTSQSPSRSFPWPWQGLPCLSSLLDASLAPPWFPCSLAFADGTDEPHDLRRVAQLVDVLAQCDAVALGGPCACVLQEPQTMKVRIRLPGRRMTLPTTARSVAKGSCDPCPVRASADDLSAQRRGMVSVSSAYLRSKATFIPSTNPKSR